MKSFKPNPLSIDQLSVIFESMLDGVVIHNEKGEIIQYNQSALKILGLSADQLLGRTSFDPMWRAVNRDQTPAGPETHPSTIARLQGTTVKDQIMGVYVSYSDLRWMNITAVPIFKKGSNEVIQVVVTFSDITDLIKRTEELTRLKDEMQERKKNIQLIFDSLPALIGHWDKNLINIRSNKLYADYFGKTPDEIEGKHVKDILGDRLFEINKTYMQKALAGEEQTFERDIETKSGIKNTIATYIPEISGEEVKGFFVLVTDVTKLRKLERQRKEVEAKLLGTVRLSWLGEMAGGVAHEINNPLTIVLGNIAVMKMQIEENKFTSEDLLRGFGKLEKSVERIAKIVKSLVQFSRDGEKDIIAKVKISEILNEVQNLCAERMKQNSIAFEIERFADCTLNVKQVEILQSLLALVFNSFDAIQNKNDKWIKLKIINEEKSVAFIVEDSGSKIPPEVAEKMMIPFFTTKLAGKGVGLGLCVAKSIALKYHGDLMYVLEAEQTTFSFKIQK